MIKHTWYAVGEASSVTTKPSAHCVLGCDVVVFRNALGQLHALSRYCPHRGCDFILGSVDIDSLVCPYHGWRFRGDDGQCTHIPANAPSRKVSPTMKVHSFPLREAGGLLWVCVGDAERARPLDLFPMLTQPNYHKTFFQVRWQAHFSRVVESVLDVSHLPFVHPNTTGTHVDPRVHGPDYAVTNIGLTIRPTPFAARHPMEPRPDEWMSDAQSIIEFRFPNHWMIRAQTGADGEMCTYLTFTPVDDETTDIFGYTLRNFAEDISFLDEYHMAHTLRVMEEDRVIVESIRPRQAPFNLQDERHVPSDAPPLHWRKWLKQAWLSELTDECHNESRHSRQIL